MSITPNYYPYYRATSDYAYETAIKAETTARLAKQTADYARGLHKDLDERTRKTEKRTTALEQTVKGLQDLTRNIEEGLGATLAANIGIGRLERLEQRIAALEPKPAEPTAADQIDQLIGYFGKIEDCPALDSFTHYQATYALSVLRKARKALDTVNRF